MIKNNLKFFLPFEFDQVPEQWNPWNDTWNKNSKKLYIWDCFKEIPCDGLLISKSKFDDNRTRLNITPEKVQDLKKILNIKPKIKLFGDCGAFQYKDKDKPPYKVKEVLNYYQNCGFDMGCSIDHIITDKKNRKLRERRYLITREMAKESIEVFNDGNYSFELFGVAQGWDLKSYSDMVEFLYELGYKYICIGGLVGLKTKSKNPKEFTLIKLLNSLKAQFDKFNFEKIHIFGRGNLSLINLYQEVGITQFDNNIMRKAWTDEKKSYHLFKESSNEIRYYTSIRIPLVKNTQGKQMEELEIFENLCDLSQNKISDEDFINKLKNYYKNYETIHPNKKFKVNQDLISDLLNDKPWVKCECDICKKYGIHICVFRRRMRNTLRAFHNVYNYYLYLRTKESSNLRRIRETYLAEFA